MHFCAFQSYVIKPLIGLVGWLAVLAAVAASADDVAQLRLNFWGSPFEKGAIEKAVESFNTSHPKIHVTAQHTPYSAYAEKISAEVAAGTPPDVAYLD
ncbi:MAG: extracellular solute-binding protein, partial [Verrucomicrobia bacterium]|nr:extracellular solute-binding protein [Verrucomicrobiota bacterium]